MVRGQDFDSVIVMPTAALAVVGETTPEARIFVEEVTARGILLEPVAQAPSTSPLVLLITQDAPDQVATDWGGREILPVTLVDEFTQVLPHLSHVAPHILGIGPAADRVATAVRYGGENLAAWERYQAGMHAWEQRRSDALLLGATDQVVALRLLNGHLAERDPDGAERLRVFVQASKARLLRLRRRFRALIAAVSVVLLAATGVAGWRTVVANEAAQIADEATALADGQRLVSHAQHAIGNDPDLPLILADLARHRTPAQEVQNAVVDVTATQVPHTSYRSPVPPSRLSVAPDGTILLLNWEDQTVRVLDSTDEIVAELPYTGTGELTSVAVDDAAGRIALLADDGLLTVLAMDGSTLMTKQLPEADFAELHGWWDGDSVMVALDNMIVGVDVRSGDQEALIEAANLERVAAVGLSPDGGHLVLSDHERIQVWAAPSGELIHDIEQDDGVSLTVDDSGRVVFVARFPALTRIVFADEGEPEVQTMPLGQDVRTVASLPGGHIAAMDSLGTGLIYAEQGSISPLTTFHAHDDSFGRVQARGDQLVTFANDGYIRRWDTSGLAQVGRPVTPGSPASLASLLGLHRFQDAVFSPATLRNQIVRLPDGDLAVMATSHLQFITVNAITLEPTADSFPVMDVRRLILDRDGDFVLVSFVDGQAQTVVLRPDPSTGITGGSQISHDGPPLTMVTSGVEPFLTDVAASGRAAIASARHLFVLDADGGSQEIRLSPSSRPLAVQASAREGAQVLTEAGRLHRLDGSTEDLAQQIDPDGETRIVAGAFRDDLLFLLGSDGSLLRWDGDDLEPILPAQTLLGTGTLKADTEGDRLLHVAGSSVSVVDLAAGSVMASRSAPLGVPLDDATMATDETVAVITAAGTVALWPLAEMDDRGRQHVTAPRGLSEGERARFFPGAADG